MTNRLAIDDQGISAPVMALASAGGLKVNFTAASAVSAEVPAGDRTGAYVTLRATQDCYVEVGGSGVTANTTTSHFFAAGERRDIYLPLATRYIAAIRATADGVLNISRYDGTR